MKYGLGLMVLCTTMGIHAQTISDDSINSGETLTLTTGNTYTLDGLVFVEENATLIIEPGVIIKGVQTPSNGDGTSALIIARGGTIQAQGTARQPIIFTSEIDDLAKADDLTPADRGLWGGVIILGEATNNNTTGVDMIEGVPDPRAEYGGGNDTDDSGIFRYVSIRHGGASIGPGNDLAGLTLGCVGSGTTIEYVEAYAGNDDGFDIYGGTANTRYLSSTFNADDPFDTDTGARGNHQFWLAIQSRDLAGRIGEHDGGAQCETCQPYAVPQIRNATYIGAGTTSTPLGDGAEAVYFRDNSGGIFHNSIITRFTGENGGFALRVEDLGSGDDSRTRLEQGELLLAGNIWWQFGNGNDWLTMVQQDFVRDHLIDNQNRNVDPGLRGISRSPDGQLDPRPRPDGEAAGGALQVGGSGFVNTNHVGAFDPYQPLWTDGWSALFQLGFTPDYETRLSLWSQGETILSLMLFLDNQPQ